MHVCEQITFIKLSHRTFLMTHPILLLSVLSNRNIEQSLCGQSRIWYSSEHGSGTHPDPTHHKLYIREVTPCLHCIVKYIIPWPLNFSVSRCWNSLPCVIIWMQWDTYRSLEDWYGSWEAFSVLIARPPWAAHSMNRYSILNLYIVLGFQADCCFTWCHGLSTPWHTLELWILTFNHISGVHDAWPPQRLAYQCDIIELD